MDKRIVVIILGNRLNDDGSLSEIGKERLVLAKEIDELFNPDYFILSGGVANPKAKISEAEAMYNYLVEIGFNKNKLIMEMDSMTTVQNAKYSVPMAKDLGAEIIMVCTSPYHFGNPIYRAMESFVNETKDTGVALMTYCK